MIALFRPFATLLAMTLLLSACVETEADLANAKVPGGPSECTATSRSGRECVFRNAPLRLDPKPVKLAGRPYTFYPLAQTLEFLDASGKDWTAPQGTLTDGASIPQVFVPVVGSPRTPEFAAAAAVHDAYCGVGNEDGPVYHEATWQEVHRVFYDTLVAGGTPEVKAKVMFAAVWLAGPRWEKGARQSSDPMAGVPREILTTYMLSITNHIEINNPSLPELIPFLNRQFFEIRALAFPERADPVQIEPNRATQGPGIQGNGPLVTGPNP